MVDVACGMHNYAPAKHFEGHSFARRLFEEETSLLVDMSKSMVRPKEILVTLKQKDALNVTTMKTIYDFKPFHFRELRGNISITALDHVLVESKRADDVGIDALGRPIPLDSINPHWRTLEIVQKLKNDKVELSCEPKFDLILKQFNASDYTMKLEILHKLGEIANPQSTFLIEPDVKPNPRDKGHKKIDVSTRRGPCAFELVQSRHDSHSPMDTQIPTQDSVKVYQTRTTMTYSYVDALLVGLKPYIRLINDVDADGNCGFRAIASLMGLTEAK
ncbi:hypothetical protein ACSBR2_001335 [Camellia fascicularis]